MDILTRLTDSRSKAALLSRLLERPHSAFSVSGLGRLADLPKASVSVIVARWEKEGLVLSQAQGRNKLVSLNPGFYLLPELKKISEKSRNPQKQFLDKLRSLSSFKSRKVKAVVLFGSRAREDFSHFSDFDVMIGVDSKEDSVTERVMEEFAHATRETGVRFSPAILEKKEIRRRWKEKDRFLQGILANGKIIKGATWLEHAQTAP